MTQPTREQETREKISPQIHGVLYELTKGELPDTQSALRKIEEVVESECQRREKLAVEGVREKVELMWTHKIEGENGIFAPQGLVDKQEVIALLSPSDKE